MSNNIIGFKSKFHCYFYFIFMLSASILFNGFFYSGYAETPPSFCLKWGIQGNGDGEFSYPSHVAIDNEGYIYVTDLNNSRVQKFDLNGNFITKWGNYGGGDEQFISPWRIAVDYSGNVFVSDGSHFIRKFTGSGDFILKWGGLGSGDGQFNGPWLGMGIDKNGNIYVSDTSNHRIQKFSNNGNFIAKWGGNGTDNGQFNFPSDVHIDNDGNVYVADRQNNRIQKFDANGTFIMKWGESGSGIGQFYLPDVISVDGSNNVYVSDSGNSRIQKFSSNGNFLCEWGSQGSGDGQFDGGRAEVDSDGNVYVADWHNHRIQKFCYNPITVPTLLTDSVTKITQSSASSGGNVSSDGGSSVTDRGVCWSTSSNPTTANSKTSDGTGTGTFASSITGLIANTTYYVRAYAINSAGTAYGNQVSFTTSEEPDTTPPTAPTFKSSAPSANTWTNNNTFTVSWNAGTDSKSGVAGYSYILDTSPSTEPDNAVETADTLFTSSQLPDGSHYFHIRTVDNAGNVSTTLHIGPFKLDTVSPAAPTFKSSDVPAQTWTNSTGITVSWNPGLDSGSGVAGYSCIFDTFSSSNPDSTVDTAGTQITGSSFSDGTDHYLHVRTLDNAGNVSSTLHVGPFYIDTSEPYGTVTINSGASSTASLNVNLSLWAGDAGSGVSQMQFSNDSVNWSAPETYAVSKNWTLASGEGTKTVYARFSDNAGNWIAGNYPHDTILFEIPDTTPPTAPTFNSSDPSVNTWTNDNTVTVSWNAGTDSKSGVAGYSWIFDTNPAANPDNTVETAATQVTGSPLSDGSAHYFHVRTVDNAGNASSTLHVGPFQIDTSPPLGMININNGAASTLTRNVNLSLSAADTGSGMSQMRFSNDNLNWSSAENYAVSKAWTLSSGEGNRRVYARFSDNAGNWTATDIYDDILLESPPPPTAPSLKTASPSTNTWSNDNTVTVSWYPGTSQNSGVAGYSLVMDSSPFTEPDSTVETVETTFTSAPLADGKHYFHIRTVDNTGNVSETQHLGPFKIDTAPPEGTGIVINNGDAFTPSAGVTLSLSAADSGSGMGKMQFSNDRVYWSVPQNYAAGADWTVLSGKGTRTVYARFSDVAGNWTETGISDEIDIATGAFGRLILIAGGGAEASNTLWPVTKELAASVYRNFILRGFTDEDIFFLSPQDIDYNGDGFYDKVADLPPENENRNISLNDVEHSLKNWAVDAHIPGIPLYIWLIDHGYPDDGTHGPWFVISPGQALYADALDSLIDAYESAVENSTVIVVNESCYSGQFLSPLKKPGRIVITASEDKTVNYSNLGANSFTNLFIQMLFENNNLRDGFGKAADYLVRDRLTENQHPQMDDNGDGKYDQFDGMLAASMKLGSDFVMGAPWPRILSAEREDISENQIAFSVSTNAHMKRVWATVQPPGYVPDMSGEYQYINLETFDFSDNDGDMVYDGTYADFNKNGTYIIRFYARDQFGNTAVTEPMEIMIGTAEPGDVNGDGSVNLADAVIALKICADIPVSGTEINTDAAVGGDSRIGVEEAVYVLRKISGQ